MNIFFNTEAAEFLHRVTQRVEIKIKFTFPLSFQFQNVKFNNFQAQTDTKYGPSNTGKDRHMAFRKF